MIPYMSKMIPDMSGKSPYVSRIFPKGIYI